jgi:hypothetical protein
MRDLINGRIALNLAYCKIAIKKGDAETAKRMAANAASLAQAVNALENLRRRCIPPLPY